MGIISCPPPARGDVGDRRREWQPAGRGVTGRGAERQRCGKAEAEGPTSRSRCSRRLPSAVCGGGTRGPGGPALPRPPCPPGPRPQGGSEPDHRKVPGTSPAHRETQTPSAWVRVRLRKAVTYLKSPSQCRHSRVFTEKSLRTKRKKPPVRDRGDPEGPNDDDSASRGQPSGPLRYGRVPGLRLWKLISHYCVCVCVCVWTVLESKL